MKRNPQKCQQGGTATVATIEAALWKDGLRGTGITSRVGAPKKSAVASSVRGKPCSGEQFGARKQSKKPNAGSTDRLGEVRPSLNFALVETTADGKQERHSLSHLI